MGGERQTMGQAVESPCLPLELRSKDFGERKRVACSKEVSLGRMPHALSCKEKRGKQPLLISL